MQKRRHFYEDELAEDPKNYDAWFDYVRLEEASGNHVRTRDVYERAIAQIPPVQEKRFWRRYIYLWINYALYEELNEDEDQCRAVYTKMIATVPHKKFSFSKIWRYYAEFELRQGNLDKTRQIYGRAIAECGKEKIFTSYADLETRLGNVDRCRKIYAKFIELHSHNPKAWIALVDLELMMEEADRARAVCEIAIGMDLDMPDLMWKTYIDLEVNLNELERARIIYERLLEKTQHFKVYKAFADFEFHQAGSIKHARKILKAGVERMKAKDLSEERAVLLEFWLQVERENRDEEAIATVYKQLPKKVRRKRTITADDGSQQGWEEYTAYVFPDDAKSQSSLKLLQAAKNWKRTVMKEGGSTEN
eukprot:GHVN01016018.1.p1 GENE.GHVN01016018.1~~GHVN01016018.1.p1  ORF type:complete len:363 (-),score=49.05 GHVN01016018.1:153-1241(-)